MSDVSAVLSANRAFYRAFASRDPEAMTTLWAAEGPVARSTAALPTAISPIGGGVLAHAERASAKAVATKAARRIKCPSIPRIWRQPSRLRQARKGHLVASSLRHGAEPRNPLHCRVMRYFKMNGCGNEFVIIDARSRGSLPLSAARSSPKPADGTRRVVLYMHGGAFVTCGANTHGRLVTKLSKYADSPKASTAHPRSFPLTSHGKTIAGQGRPKTAISFMNCTWAPSPNRAPSRPLLVNSTS